MSFTPSTCLFLLLAASVAATELISDYSSDCNPFTLRNGINSNECIKAVSNFCATKGKSGGGWMVKTIKRTRKVDVVCGNSPQKTITIPKSQLGDCA